MGKVPGRGTVSHPRQAGGGDRDIRVRRYTEQNWTSLSGGRVGLAVREGQEEVQPARFEDTPLPGLVSGMVTADLRRRPRSSSPMIVGKLGVLVIAVSAPLADARDPAGYPVVSVSPVPILREPGHLDLPLLAG
jgi:hypothetical protein